MFAVILAPNFHLQAALRWRESLDSKAVAVTDDCSGKSVILECNEQARASGVEPRMSCAQALARCPSLVLLSRALREEQAAQAVLLETAFSLSPEVEETAAGCCTADLRRAPVNAREASCTGIIERLQSMRLRAKIGIAPNPDLAFLAARRADPLLMVASPQAFLSQLAVAEIDPPPDLLAILRDWGIHTLGQLTGLPQGEFADRLGPDAHRLWQRAAGNEERLLRLARPAEEFAEAFDFEHGIETVEPLYFVLRRFLDHLCRRLEASHRVAAKLVLTLPLEDGARHERSFAIPSPTRDAEALFRIVSTHLEGLQLERHPVGIRLEIEPAHPGMQQYRLFENPLRDPNRFGETLARIAALVGTGNSGVAEISDTHRPDSYRMAGPAFHKAPAETQLYGRGGRGPDTAIGLPLRRYRPPFPARVRVAREMPVQVFSEKAHGEVVDSLGPYRASGNWWEEEPWGAEEWDVEIAGCGLFRISRRNGQWFIEGCYDAAIY